MRQQLRDAVDPGATLVVAANRVDELAAVGLDEAPERRLLLRRDDRRLRRIVALVGVVDEVRHLASLDQAGRPVVDPVARRGAGRIGRGASHIRPRKHRRDPEAAERIRVAACVERERVLRGSLRKRHHAGVLGRIALEPLGRLAKSEIRIRMGRIHSRPDRDREQGQGCGDRRESGCDEPQLPVAQMAVRRRRVQPERQGAQPACAENREDRNRGQQVVERLQRIHLEEDCDHAHGHEHQAIGGAVAP